MSAPHTPSGDRWTAVASAVIAVLAALATLFANHRSISALSVKNDAILTTAKASDLYTTYQTRRVRVAMYSSLLTAGIIPDPKARENATASMNSDQASSVSTLAAAKELETKAEGEQVQSQGLLHSYETLEISATLFEIAIVFASISALTTSRMMLWGGVGLSGAGLVLMAIGLLQH